MQREFGQLALTYSLLPADMAAAVFPAANRCPASDPNALQIVTALDTSSLARVVAVTGRVRDSISELLRARRIAFAESASLPELADALAKFVATRYSSCLSFNLLSDRVASGSYYNRNLIPERRQRPLRLRELRRATQRPMHLQSLLRNLRQLLGQNQANPNHGRVPVLKQRLSPDSSLVSIAAFLMQSCNNTQPVLCFQS